MKRLASPWAILALVLLASLASCQKAQEDLVSPAAPAAPGSAPLLGFTSQAPLAAPTTPEPAAAAPVAPALPQPTTFEGWVGLGNQRMDSGFYAEAIVAYEAALALNAKDTNVRVDLGTCYFYSGNPDQAIVEYRKAIALDPKHANAHYNSGVVLEQGLKRPLDAAVEYETFAKVAPGDPRAPQALLIAKRLRSGN
jgi:tetratricopeptide (TPR) repeat protein